MEFKFNKAFPFEIGLNLKGKFIEYHLVCDTHCFMVLSILMQINVIFLCDISSEIHFSVYPFKELKDLHTVLFCRANSAGNPEYFRESFCGEKLVRLKIFREFLSSCKHNFWKLNQNLEKKVRLVEFSCNMNFSIKFDQFTIKIPRLRHCKNFDNFFCNYLQLSWNFSPSSTLLHTPRTIPCCIYHSIFCISRPKNHQ